MTLDPTVRPNPTIYFRLHHPHSHQTRQSDQSRPFISCCFNPTATRSDSQIRPYHLFPAAPSPQPPDPTVRSDPTIYFRLHHPHSHQTRQSDQTRPFYFWLHHSHSHQTRQSGQSRPFISGCITPTVRPDPTIYFRLHHPHSHQTRQSDQTRPFISGCITPTATRSDSQTRPSLLKNVMQQAEKVIIIVVEKKASKAAKV